MKPFFSLLTFLVFSNVVFGQNYSLSTLVNTDTMNMFAIYKNPTDPSSILVLENGDWTNSGPEYNIFSADLAGNYSPIISTIFGDLKTLPIEFDGKFYFAAETQSLGVELIAFDGTTASVIDVEIGTIGSTPYSLKVENGLLYFSAIKAGKHQIFSFSNGTGLNQITNEDGSEGLIFISKIDTNLFYSKYEINGLNELKRLTNSGSSSVIRSSNFNISGIYASWPSIVKVGSRFLIFEDFRDLNLRNSRVLGTNDFVTIDTLIDENNLPIQFEDKFEIINGHIFAKLHHHYYEYNGSNFSQFYPSLTNGLIDLFYFENAYYGLAINNEGEPDKIFKFDGGVATELYSNRHLHLLLLNDHDAYFSDLNSDSTMQSGIVRLSYDQIDTIPVSLKGLHSPIQNAALMWDNKLTFLYSNNLLIENTDIIQLDGLLSINTKEKDSFKLFPNPVKVDKQLFLYTQIDGHLECFNTIGQKVKSQDIFVGNNTVDLSGFASGTYILKLNGHTFKQIIE